MNKRTAPWIICFMALGPLWTVPLWSNEPPAPEASENEMEVLVSEAQKMAAEWAARIREWRGQGGSKTTYMGVVIEPVPEVLRDYVDLPDGIGLLLAHIAEDGPAERGGLMKNDILVSFDDQLVVNLSQLSTLIDYKGAGSSVPVRILRKGEEMEFSVILEERIGRSGGFLSPGVPKTPTAPRPPDLGSPDEIGRYMEKIDEWIPGSVRIFIDDNEQVQIDLQELKENLQDLRTKLLQLQRSGEAISQIRKEYGDRGARTTIVRVEDQTVNYQSDQGKLVLTSSEAGQQVMIWNEAGALVYQGPYPVDPESGLPAEAVDLLKAFEASRLQLRMDESEESMEIHLNEDLVNPVTSREPFEGCLRAA